MNRLSRRQFLRASGTVVGATMVPSLALSQRVGANEKSLIPKKMPFPPNDEFGSYEPTITPDGNTIYFARFAGSGDKRQDDCLSRRCHCHPAADERPGRNDRVFTSNYWLLSTGGRNDRVFT